MGELFAHLIGDEGGERFDAAGWHYLDTLARRAAGHEGSVRRLLEAKLERAAAAFAERFAKARAAAAELLQRLARRIRKRGPSCSGCMLTAISKACGSCAPPGSALQCAALGALVSRLEPAAAVAPRHPHRAACRLPHARTEDRARITRYLGQDERRQTAGAGHETGPKNAGPINSHMLVLRSLAMMQEISPDYLGRMVSYADTLLFLDPGEVEVPAKRKKAPPAKVAKPANAKRK
jgi:hypothetical protein